MKYFKLKQIIALVCLVLLSGSVAFAQRQISGVVTDADNGEPLIGASVRAIGTTSGAITDFEGRYAFPLPEGATQLEVSYTGYTTQTLDIGAATTLDFSMSSGITLEETTIIGYGTVKKTDVTGAILTVGPKDFNKGAMNSPQELIVGKIAGVTVTTNAEPGGGATIRIRGGSSLGASNDPLIVIDGIPVDNETVAGGRSPLNIVNPNDIETFTVLKDASATAIYGSRASNGVILITTKKGSLKRKIGIDYNANFSLSSRANSLEVLDGNAFRALINERYPDGSAARNLLGTANTDWQDEIYQQAFGMDHNLAVSGGIGVVPYRVSLGYTDRDGILKTDNFNRLSGALNLSPGFMDNRLQFNVNLKVSKSKNVFANRGAVGASIFFDPTKPVLDPSSPYGGYFTWTNNDGTPNTLASANPVAQLMLHDDKSDVKRLIGNVQVDYRFHFLPELRANLNVGYDNSNSEGSVLEPAEYSAAFNTSGLDKRYTQEKTNKLIEYYMNYVKDFGSTTLDLMGGYSWQHFHFDDVTTTFNTANPDGAVVPNEREYYLLSLFGRLNFSINDKYLFTFTLRRDGTSRFAEENRWGMFPSAAFAWKVIDGRSGVLNGLKLRLGYGITGQQDISTDYYPYLARYQGSLPTADYPFGNEYITTLRPNGYDRNIKWEETATYNAGIDYELANGRVYGSAEVYLRKTSDLINKISVPAGTNLTNEIFTNVGDLENRGVEVSVNTIPVQRSNFSWTLGANFTINRNEITKLTLTDDPNYLGVETGTIQGGVGNNIQINSVGYPAWSFYVYEQVYDALGVPIEGLYVDRNNDGQITPADKYRFENRAADLLVGFYTNFTFGKFDLSTGGRASFGNYLYNNGQSEQTSYNRLYAPTNYLGNLQAIYKQIDFENPRLFSDHFVQDASFLRFDHITLGYNFANLGALRNLRVYGTVQNPFVITDYQGIDPEEFDGIDDNVYPRSRIFLLGLNASF
ncbi:MAG: SusC/RagA family TonB-linked outer membrane protein [Lewinellaceae bacterium]|nr:SusC/RagA family TonB-linked outer membrane protein [Saprospiraceae bacterium]MCB9330867.1 SusC/RagA family TonB-linked outer membrane protein [Lewinellaceae bacterium]